MSKENPGIVFHHNCVKCDKPMIDLDGTPIGGFMTSIHPFDTADEAIITQWCWPCAIKFRP